MKDDIFGKPQWACDYGDQKLPPKPETEFKVIYIDPHDFTVPQLLKAKEQIEKMIVSILGS